MKPALLTTALLTAALSACRAPPPATALAPARPPSPRIIPGDPDAAPLFGDVQARATRLGAGPTTLVASGEAAEGERLGAFVGIPPDACLLVYARASSSIEDLDLAAFDDEGAPVAVDEGPDPKPAIVLCPEGSAVAHPPRLYIGAHVVTGEGLVGVGAQTVPRDRAAEVARVLGAHGTIGTGPRPVDAWQGLDDHVRAHRQALGGSWEEFRKAAVVLDSRVPTVVGLPIAADGCVDAVVVPGDEVALLEIEAVDEAGRVVARARDTGGDTALTVCSPMAFDGSLLLRPHLGRGLGAVVLARTRGASARDLTARPELIWQPGRVPTGIARREHERVLAQAGYGAPSVAVAAELPLGRRVGVPLDLGAADGSTGACVRLDVVGGAPLALVDAALWTESGEPGELVSSGEGVWGTVLFACARGRARLELEAGGRGGPAVVTRRPEIWKDRAFSRYPLAAARMLARAAEGSDGLLAGSPAGARALSLDPDSRVTWTESVARGECLSVVAGAQGEGVGLELRGFDASTGDELDRSHASRAAGVRACAGLENARDVRFELRSTGGRPDVVVGERIAR